MTLLPFILVGVLFVFLFLGLYFIDQSRRIKKVYQFRMMLLERASKFSHDRIKEGKEWRVCYDWFNSLPSYDTMCNKFWVLDLNKFITESLEDYLERIDSNK